MFYVRDISRAVFFAMFILVSFFAVSFVQAQQTALEEEAVIASAAEEQQPVEEAVDDEINPNNIPSVLFTYWERTAIVDARRSIGMARPATEGELAEGENPEERVKPPPEEREIRLGGIVYEGAERWTIWLNEQRVTPDSLPTEILDLRVFNEYIEVKWFDEWSNQIFPIRLRPHQRFNIDTRIFLPG